MKKIILAFSFLAVAPLASAAMVNVTYTAQIEYVHDWSNNWGTKLTSLKFPTSSSFASWTSLSKGDVINGSFSYDSAALLSGEVNKGAVLNDRFAVATTSLPLDAPPKSILSSSFIGFNQYGMKGFHIGHSYCSSLSISDGCSVLSGTNDWIVSFSTNFWESGGNIFSGTTAPTSFDSKSVGQYFSYNYMNGKGEQVFATARALSCSATPIVTPVPEPETYALMGMGLLGLLAARRSKAKQ